MTLMGDSFRWLSQMTFMRLLFESDMTLGWLSSDSWMNVGWVCPVTHLGDSPEWLSLETFPSDSPRWLLAIPINSSGWLSSVTLPSTHGPWVTLPGDFRVTEQFIPRNWETEKVVRLGSFWDCTGLICSFQHSYFWILNTCSEGGLVIQVEPIKIWPMCCSMHGIQTNEG